jgi:conjugal transfer pilus assembly protein TrbC
MAMGVAMAQTTGPDIEDLVRTAEARAAQTRAALTGVDPEDTMAKSLRYQEDAEALSAGNRGRLRAGMAFLSQDFRIDPYADPGADMGPGVVYVAVSLSMPRSSLRQLARDAHTAGAVLVIRGLVDNSFIKTQRLLKEVFVEGEEAGLVIDPRVFQQFKVNEVPAVIAAPKEVQSCEDGLDCVRTDVPYDVVRGNISLQQALTLLAQKGEAAPAASRRALSKLED